MDTARIPQMVVQAKFIISPSDPFSFAFFIRYFTPVVCMSTKGGNKNRTNLPLAMQRARWFIKGTPCGARSSAGTAGIAEFNRVPVARKENQLNLALAFCRSSPPVQINEYSGNVGLHNKEWKFVQ
jgi:hypothetical protein